MSEVLGAVLCDWLRTSVSAEEEHVYIYYCR
jgi:hypothetical protein